MVVVSHLVVIYCICVVFVADTFIVFSYQLANPAILLSNDIYEFK